MNDGLAGRGLADAGLEDAPHVSLLHLIFGDAGLEQGGFDGGGAQARRGDGGERPSERTDGGPFGADDVDFLHKASLAWEYAPHCIIKIP